MSVLSKVLRAGEGKKVRRLAELVPMVNALEPTMEALSDEELQAKTIEFRARLDQGETLDDLLIEAYAVVREAAWRVLGQRHFDVQIMGGMALHFGWIAEMRTGEGKTLVSTLPAYLNALNGRGVHMVTVNDYLATRDSEWMGQLHTWLGLSVGRVGPDITDPEAKRAAYACDITYGTNTELGFDYLRDNMARSRETMAQREHVFAVAVELRGADAGDLGELPERCRARCRDLVENLVVEDDVRRHAVLAGALEPPRAEALGDRAPLDFLAHDALARDR